MPKVLINDDIKGKIFNIQRYCVGDGPGIRTTVFLKGCPLNCSWCHNPESHSFLNEIGYNSTSCIKCGKCITACSNNCHSIVEGNHLYDRLKCNHCFKCVEVCPSALETVGREVTVKEVISEVLEDKVFYKESGGITLSGGEPLSQPEFAFELLKSAKSYHLTTCVETSGYVKFEVLEKVMPYVDLFLYDYKLTDAEKHKKYTGADNLLILQNLFKLDDKKAKIVLRCPIIPGLNDNDEHFNGIASVANSLKNLSCVEIEPAHKIGDSKYLEMGYAMPIFSYSVPDDLAVDLWIKKLQSKICVRVKRV